jgi:hypothetical protein
LYGGNYREFSENNRNHLVDAPAQAPQSKVLPSENGKSVSATLPGRAGAALTPRLGG